MSVGSYEVSHRPPALAHRMAQWSGARPNWRAAGGSNRGSGIRFFRTASPHTPYISAFLGRPPRPQAPNLSIFWTGLPAGTPRIYPHRWTAFVRIFRGPVGTFKVETETDGCGSAPGPRARRGPAHVLRARAMMMTCTLIFAYTSLHLASTAIYTAWYECLEHQKYHHYFF